MDDLTGYFIAETRESLDHIGEALIAWEADPADMARLDDIFRFVHTVKGSCGFLDLVRIEALAHAAETVLALLRAGKRHADAPLVSAILAVIDRIAVLADALESDAEFPPLEGDAMLIAALDGDAAPPVVAKTETPATRPTRNVRINVDLIDTMMTQVSDLVLVRNELARAVNTARGDSDAEVALSRLSTRIADLRDSIAHARLQPVERLFAALPRLVRDTAAELGKSVDLVISGGDVELDREMVEYLRDPLIHIVRNAIDHGIELPDQRRQAGKAAAALLRVTARQSGNQIAIEICDDGRGLDLDRLRTRAGEAGAIDAQRAASLSDEDAAQLAFAPGVTTANTITAISGRGIGMDVVRENVERLGGSIMLHNRPGQGLTVELRSPLTLSILTVLTVKAGSQRFAIPRAVIDEVFATSASAVKIARIGAARVATIRGELLSVIALADIMALDAGEPSHLMVIDSGGGHRWALAIDAVGAFEDVVVRPVAPIIGSGGLFAGQTLPDAGAPILMLDVHGLLRRTRIETRASAEVHLLTPPPAAIALLTFTGLDGKRRAVEAGQVDRIDTIAVDRFARVGRDAVVTIDSRLQPALIDGDLPGNGDVAVLRLTGGTTMHHYPVGEVHDLTRVALADIYTSGKDRVALIGDVAVPLFDPIDRCLAVAPKRRRAS